MVMEHTAEWQCQEDETAELLSQMTLHPPSPSPPSCHLSPTARDKKREIMRIFGEYKGLIDSFKGSIRLLSDPSSFNNENHLSTTIMLTKAYSQQYYTLARKLDLLREQQRYKVLKDSIAHLALELDTCHSHLSKFKRNYGKALEALQRMKTLHTQSTNTFNSGQFLCSFVCCPSPTRTLQIIIIFCCSMVQESLSSW